jgi:electron transfer flavoprotein alpha subunit
MAQSLYGIDSEESAIWVFLEQEDQAIENVSLEILTKGRQMADQVGWPLVGLLLGHGISDLAREAFAYGADEVVLAEHSALAPFTVDGFTQAAYQVLTERKPSVFLLGATSNGRDLAGRLAVRLRTGLNADCTDLRLDKERGVLVSEVSGFGGGVLALIEMEKHRPQMATVRPGVFQVSPANYTRDGQLTHFQVEIVEELIHTKIVEQVKGRDVDLTQAQVLVAGGRGVDGKFEMLEKLARLLNGEVGATRPPVDEGHIERERQIGQTGVICRPKVSINCGISGAFHFVVGIQEADMVIAINTDPEAPIFDYADYCVVGDVQKIIPALIEAIRKKGSTSSPQVLEVQHA